jgi:hypothetical protein
VRQERIRKSIKVLGPTDPQFVRSYVRGGRKESVVLSGCEGLDAWSGIDDVGVEQKRLPGYMVGGER